MFNALHDQANTLCAACYITEKTLVLQVGRCWHWAATNSPNALRHLKGSSTAATRSRQATPLTSMIAMEAGILLKSRNKHMCLVQSIVATVLYAGHASTKVTNWKVIQYSSFTITCIHILAAAAVWSQVLVSTSFVSDLHQFLKHLFILCCRCMPDLPNLVCLYPTWQQPIWLESSDKATTERFCSGRHSALVLNNRVSLVEKHGKRRCRWRYKPKH